MVTCQSSELGWEVTVELPAIFLSLGRGSFKDRCCSVPVGFTAQHVKYPRGVSRLHAPEVL